MKSNTSDISESLSRENFANTEPLLVANTFGKHSILRHLQDQINSSDRFFLAVSFLKSSGLALLKDYLKSNYSRGGKAQILISDYLNITEPQALRDILELFPNWEIKLYRCPQGSPGFHVKSYGFYRNNKPKAFGFFVGSANISHPALSINHEWMLWHESKIQSTLEIDATAAFNRLWNDCDFAHNLRDCLEEYTLQYQNTHHSNSIPQTDLHTELAANIKPNVMQQEFVTNLLSLKHANENRALLISATGTGKTIASAFGVAKLNPKRFLFLVHRHEILAQALESYGRVLSQDNFNLHKINPKLGPDTFFKHEKLGLFSMVGAMSDSKELWPQDFFDVIVVDEAHHVGGQTYRDLFDHFKPKMWLGLTATPDRPDQYNVYEHFDHNVALEVRLQQASDAGMLVPFIYYGIGEPYESTVLGDIDLNSPEFLAWEKKRFCYILKNMREKYVHYPVHGLVFAQNIREAKAFAEFLCKNGEPAMAIDGSTPQAERLQAFKRLQSTDEAHLLRYLVSVDVLNEGVDIPKINQVVFMRRTESIIVYIQQLGRGLRKAPNKDVVAVLDFVGNHDNNYMVGMALAGGRISSTGEVVTRLRSGSLGNNIIELDEIARERIFRSLNTAQLSKSHLVRDAVLDVYARLGRIPTLIDLDSHTSNVDPSLLLRLQECAPIQMGKWIHSKYKECCIPNWDQGFQDLYKYVSKEFGRVPRRLDVLALQYTLNNPDADFPSLDLQKLYQLSDKERTNIEAWMSIDFYNEVNEASYAKTPGLWIKHQEQYTINPLWKSWMRQSDLNEAWRDLVEFISRRIPSSSSLVINQHYTLQDAQRHLGWPRWRNGGTVGGYAVDALSQTMAVFINLRKHDKAIAYEDRFIDESHLIALSKTNRKLNSTDALIIEGKHPDYPKLKIHLFVRRDADVERLTDGRFFEYLGIIHKDPQAPLREVLTISNGVEKPSFEIVYKLETPLDSKTLEYYLDSKS